MAKLARWVNAVDALSCGRTALRVAGEDVGPGVTNALSAGTTCYAMYANSKSGNQGSAIRDGEIIGCVCWIG